MLTKWDERFLYEARVRASWSKDPSTKVGAVVVRPDRTTAGHGFNGLPPGVDDAHALDRDFKLAAVIHAEENAVLDCRDPSLEGYTMYVWGLASCGHCTSVAIRRGVSRIVCVQERERPDWQASFAVSRTLAAEAGLSLRVLRPDELGPALRWAVIPEFKGGDA